MGGETMKNVFGKYLLPFLLILSLFLFVSGGNSEKQDKPFNWTMALQNVKTGESVPFSAPVMSDTGAQFRLLINPDAACFGYVIAESVSGDELAILHAGPLKAKEEWISPILVLSPPKGSESLFVVVSRGELADLTQRINAYNGNQGVTQRRALMNEVLRIRSEVSQFKEAPEKPVLMGAATRGSPDKTEGVEFSGLGIYVKTVSIEH